MPNNDLKYVYNQISPKNCVNNNDKTIGVRSEEIGEILKFLRQKTLLTQKGVAQNIGIAQQTYAGYENGKHEPSIEIAIRLADFYGVSMDYITGRFITSTDDLCIDEKADLDFIIEHSVAFYEGLNEQSKHFMNAQVRKPDKK
mgnify:CR=1 FL=1